MNEEFVVETDTIINNTGEDIMGETGENTVPLPNSNKRSMTLVDTEDNCCWGLFSTPEQISDLQLAVAISMESFSGYAFLYFKAVP